MDTGQSKIQLKVRIILQFKKKLSEVIYLYGRVILVPLKKSLSQCTQFTLVYAGFNSVYDFFQGGIFEFLLFSVSKFSNSCWGGGAQGLSRPSAKNASFLDVLPEYSDMFLILFYSIWKIRENRCICM